ncbi:MAG: hypothetical protein RMN25_10450, partial [Anaerolineae bacterium]|nr:hypothetical protein [Thermoflexales bacterium]MDW8408186.1 hypothetical protein [Anaerolineae bacterium]
SHAMDRLLAGYHFDFVTWIAGMALDKLGYELVRPHDGMTDADQIAFVRDFMARVAEHQRLESEIRRLYIDPNIADPEAASAEWRARRNQLRREINARQDIAEAILQEQVEAILREEGFALGGQVLPPLRFRFTRLPYILIVSPRDRILVIDQRGLRAGLTVDEQDRIERLVAKRFNVSTLVTPIGGLAAYPTMLPETASLRFAISTAAHEWAHNYLMATLAPVALRYLNDPVSRVINETAASIFEEEIAERVFQRFYPELARADQPALDQPQAPPIPKPDQPPPFDFRAEMRKTRVHVDDLLAAGKIEEAEAYMEARRKIFVQNGYSIRKLNQAYFAFHGAYNATPGGAPAAGRDPIGPAVQALRQRSATIGDFLRTISRVATLEDVERAFLSEQAILANRASR